MKQRLTMSIGAAAGAGMMYMLDPEHGRRRRKLVRDQMTRSWNRTNDLIDAASRDSEHRLQGILAETRAMLSSEPVPDDVLAQRVKSKLGRYVSHPRALDVDARDGRIIISGPILKHEVDQMMSAVESTPGVTEVEPSLEVHESPENVPSLQGGEERPGERPDFLQENWSPATRVAGTALGGVLTLGGLRRRGLSGIGIAAGGATLLARSITNRGIRQMVGMRTEEEGIQVRKAINIDAPVEEVFKLWANLENYPRFMQHVQEVRRTGTGRYHWVVEGPAGTPVEWDAVITEFEPNKKVVWKSLPDAEVTQTGFTRFDANSDGSTRLDVQISYLPPGGLIGHTVASIFGSNPKQQMDDDLVRFQTLLERGKTTAKGREVTRDEMVTDISQLGVAELESSPGS